MSSLTPIWDASAPTTFDKRIVFAATERNVRRGLSTLGRALEELDMPGEEASNVELVLAETLNNIVEHAYCDTTEGQIELRVRHDPDGLSFRVSDRGVPMPGGKPPLGARVENGTELKDLPEGGFGWYLIRELAHDLDYRREGNTNVFSFRMRVACRA